jgi:hypothetical protein
MSSYLAHVTIDCRDAYALSEWWKPVLGYVDLAGDPNLPGQEECMIHDPETGQRLLFIEVPDADLPAKRIHLDIAPRTGTRDAEVDRLLAYGAGLVADHRGKYGLSTGWVTLADPGGNQMCVLRNDAERAQV